MTVGPAVFDGNIFAFDETHLSQALVECGEAVRGAVKLLVIELLVALAIVVGIMVLWSYILTPIPVY